MDLTTIKQDTNWSDAADASNNNFLKIKLEVEKISLATNKHKGFFYTLAGLKGAYPSPIIGDNAWVGSVYPGVIHISQVRGIWKATTQIPDVPIVDLTDLSKSANIDGGSADTKYGGAIVIDGGNAEYK